jgi:CDP-diglyceride synthetase
MKERVLTGAMIFLAIIFAVMVREFSLYAFDAVVLVLMIGTSFESSSLFSKMGYYNNKKVVVAFPILLYALCVNLILNKTSVLWSIIFFLLLLILTVLISFLLSIIFRNKTVNEIKTRNLKTSNKIFALNKGVHTLFSAIYPALGLVALVGLSRLHQIIDITTLKNIAGNGVLKPELLGLFAIIIMLVVTVATDVFSMLVGKTFGKRRLAPKISPNKTVAGFVGGIVFAILFSIMTFVVLGAFESFDILFYQISLNFWKVIVLAFLGGLVCNAGDLFASSLKRKAQVKDTGSLLPGHGGLIDRFDSHTFNAVLIFLFLIIII